MDLTLQQSIIVALVSAILGSIITLVFQSVINFIGRTKHFYKFVDLISNQYINLQIKILHTKKIKYYISDISLRVYEKDGYFDLIQCNRATTSRTGEVQRVQNYKYNYVVTNEYILEEELWYFSKYKLEPSKQDFYLIINNKDYYKIELKKCDFPKYKLIKKLSYKERKQLDTGYG